ncbi:MAG: hypothetical protein IJW31_08280 [Lentisphaeria bacterium]|nr:hypothetical protein [Lentisphaeria bacterium]
MAKVKIQKKEKYKISPYLFMQFAEPLGSSDSSIDAAWDWVNESWQPGAVEMVKKLAPPMIRWGGCFASYYHWYEAVGSQKDRVPMLNLCWDGYYANMVGTCELAELAKEVNSELLFCVNFESDGRKHWAYPRPDMNRLGDADEAADWVRYCNDPDDARRQSHGYKEPFNIKYWQIGNETSYDVRGFNADENAALAPKFINKMREVDQSLKFIIWGDGFNTDWRPRYKEGLTCDWTEKVCESTQDSNHLVAFHNHFGDTPAYAVLEGMNYRLDADATWEATLLAAVDFEDRIKYMRNSVAPYNNKLAITEGHFIIRGRHRGDYLSSWYAGIAYARCVNVLQRHADVVEIATLADFMGTRWQNNAIMLPSPWSNGGEPYFLPAGTIMRLMSQHIGKFAVDVEADNNIDACASCDGNKYYLHLINLNRTEAQKIELSVGGENVVPKRILEISNDPTDEVCVLTPNIFEPKEVKVDSCYYTLPAAAVAVVEFEL